MGENLDNPITCPSCGAPLTGKEKKCPFCKMRIQQTMQKQTIQEIQAQKLQAQELQAQEQIIQEQIVQSRKIQLQQKKNAITIIIIIYAIWFLTAFAIIAFCIINTFISDKKSLDDDNNNNKIETIMIT